MIEKVRSFGDQGHLTGVIAEPAPGSAGTNLPGVVFWNAGLLHHVGPHRLFVDLARRLAQAGFTTIRFDLGGIGDSASSGKQTSGQRAVDEVRQAMDYLATSTATATFVLVGLCSGAIDAHRVAIADPRVCGAVMLDGYGYRTLGYYARYYGSRMLGLKRWGRFLYRNCRRAFVDRRKSPGDSQAVDQPVFHRFPPRRQVLEELQDLKARDVQLLYVYSGGVQRYYNYEGQFRRMFAGVSINDQVQVAYLPEADHLYTILEVRNGMMRTVCTWLQAKFKKQPRQG